ncbi:mannose-1-phosphate guanylyltransferase/mannose-6-phosphate isomerase [Cobetia amphilecti]|nr:mannose-1-phosphate guanylyltransferase/mannose-6-phosphate isomerase [Cobetia litoralis]
MHIVIVSGGSGSRLWPVSREANPKPFIKVDKEFSFLQRTFLRSLALPNIESVTTVTNKELFFRTEDEYRSLEHHCKLHYILEPFGRNTAPAIASAALEIRAKYGDDALMLILPADHLIENEDKFQEAVLFAAEAAQKGELVTFGIKPTSPDTGFGYIEVTTDSEQSTHNSIKVKRFVEKPDISTAQQYVSSDLFYWNAGMFCFKSGSLLNELELHSNDIFLKIIEAYDKSVASNVDNDTLLRLDEETFFNVPDDSIDYAVMEKSSNVSVIPCDLGWKDIGSWAAMADLTPADNYGNRSIGKVEVEESHNCYINSPNRLTAVVGLNDIFVIDTPDALLVTHKDKSQSVKKVVAKLKARGGDLHQHHLTVHRPWGTYTVLEGGSNFKIKRIEVKPNASLSLQMHHHRNEHWIVVSGTAKVINGDMDILLRTNESTYIPAGHCHRLSNPGVIPLVMIEVQSGEYLEEDDIVRFEDTYGRC